MKFTRILKDVIVEQTRFEILMDALTKPSKDKEGNTLKPKLSIKEFLTLVKADPDTKMNDVSIDTKNPDDLKKIKAGKYTQWLIKTYLNLASNDEVTLSEAKRLFFEDLYKITDDLTKFEKFKSKIPADKRDINKLTPDSLFNTVKDFDINLAKTTKSERKSAPVHPGAKIAFNGDRWRVVEISDKGALGKEAACFYGGDNKETRWCTSAPGLKYFETYINDGPLYVIFDPNDVEIAEKTGLPKVRYQFHFPSNQFMDKDDRQIDLVNFLNGYMSDLKEFFKPVFVRGLSVDGSKFVIDNLKSGSAGKFISIYGMDDLIPQLPMSTTEIVIHNKDNSGLTINIPESIGRLKNLELVIFENCVSKIPESICELTKLRFLSLPNNNELTSIPECVFDLPNILFLNLIGCKNVDVSDIDESKCTDMGNGLYDFDK